MGFRDRVDEEEEPRLSVGRVLKLPPRMAGDCPTTGKGEPNDDDDDFVVKFPLSRDDISKRTVGLLLLLIPNRVGC